MTDLIEPVILSDFDSIYTLTREYPSGLANSANSGGFTKYPYQRFRRCLDLLPGTVDEGKGLLRMYSLISADKICRPLSSLSTRSEADQVTIMTVDVKYLQRGKRISPLRTESLQ